MGVEETVQDSELLLKQMTEKPEAAVEALNLEERVRVVSKLHELTGEAVKVSSEADLLYVANSVWRLVEETPGLADRLLQQDDCATEARNSHKRRGVSRAYHEAAMGEERRYVQKRAAQIRNHIVECHKELMQALRETTERQSADDDQYS